MQINPIASGPATQPPPDYPPEQKLGQIFLEEMLKYAGPKPSDHAFGGGIGEQQFATFLTREYAAILAESLDFGFSINKWGPA